LDENGNPVPVDNNGVPLSSGGGSPLRAASVMSPTDAVFAGMGSKGNGLALGLALKQSPAWSSEWSELIAALAAKHKDNGVWGDLASVL